MKKIEELNKEDFDECGFAYLGGKYDTKTGVGQFSFFSKFFMLQNENSRNAINKLTKDAAYFVKMSKSNFEEMDKEFANSNFVKSTKMLLKNFPEQTAEIFYQIPSRIYQYPTLMYQIFQGISADEASIKKANKIMHTRMEAILASKKVETPISETAKGKAEIALRNMMTDYRNLTLSLSPESSVRKSKGE